jgi:hypothetical protein
MNIARDPVGVGSQFPRMERTEAVMNSGLHCPMDGATDGVRKADRSRASGPPMSSEGRSPNGSTDEELPLVCRPLAKESRLMTYVLETCPMEGATDYSAECRARAGRGRRIREPSQSHAFDSASSSEGKDARTARPDGRS